MKDESEDACEGGAIEGGGPCGGMTLIAGPPLGLDRRACKWAWRWVITLKRRRLPRPGTSWTPPSELIGVSWQRRHRVACAEQRALKSRCWKTREFVCGDLELLVSMDPSPSL